MIKLLLADDHPIILSGIESVLRGSRYEIAATVADGGAALEAIAGVRPDILLLDLRMPVRSGLDVLRVLRSRGDQRKVILLTADLADEELREAIQLGVNGIVLKESAQQSLVRCLDQVSADARWIEPDLLQRALNLAADDGGASPGKKTRLTTKERAVIRLVAQGQRNREIADELGMTEGTVKVYLHRLYQRLDVTNRTELAVRARALGLAD